MNETDDRLDGDPVWELFAHPAPGPTQFGVRTRRYRIWLVVGGLIAATWFVSPLSAVIAACLSVAAGDFRKAWRFTQFIQDKAGRLICALFTSAWGAWKLAAAAFGMMFVSLTLVRRTAGEGELPWACYAAMLLWMGGFSLSAALTASGLLSAYISGCASGSVKA